MKKVSIFLILLTIMTATIHIDEIKDLMMTLSVCMLFYLFGFYVSRKINLYIRRRRLENEFANIFTDKLLVKLKKDIAILRIKDELKKIPSTELCSNQSKQKQQQDNENS